MSLEVEVAPRLMMALARAGGVSCTTTGRWKEFTAEDFDGMRRKVVVDGRRILRREAMEGVELVVPEG